MGRDHVRGGSKEYNSDYYSRHRDKILDSKRDRYARDVDYRKSIRKSGAKWYQNKKEALGEYVMKPLVGGHPLHTFQVLRVGKVLSRLKITRAIFYGWESAGIIPDSSGVFGKGRYYSEEQYDVIRYVHGIYVKNKGISWKNLKEKTVEYVSKNW